MAGSIWDQGSAQTPNSSNMWYQPSGNYGQTQDWYSTPIGTEMREQNVPLAFSSWLQQRGVGNTDNTFNRWAHQQLPRFQQAYGMATMQNPLMNIDQFMATLPGYGQLRREWEMQTPNARGAGYGRVVPNARWLMR